MDKGKLSDKGEALLAAARREAAARKSTPPPAPAQGENRGAAKAAPTATERLAQLMANERTESELRKSRMRRYGIRISLTILALFVLWVLSTFRRR